MVVSKSELEWAQQHWTTANYIAASAVYLKDNFLLEKKLSPSDIKDSLLGHWGTCPGLNFIYTHLNLLIKKNNQSTLLLTGPGHGFAAIFANMFIEGSLSKYYANMKNDEKGIGNVIKSFCWPEGFPSHLNPGVPGCIHEGGELGYALGTAFGAAFDNPHLLVAAIVGDGEAETGPTATAWHSGKFLNPAKDGAVLPILHLNGYKISSPTIYSTLSDAELKDLFIGYGYQPRIVKTSHKDMANTLEWAYKTIRDIQDNARNSKNGKSVKARWPMIILKTPKGWTGIKKMDGYNIEGSWRSHQVPSKDVKTNSKSLKALEQWLRSYKPSKLFPQGKIPDSTLRFVPQGDLRIGSNPHALGGNMRKPLILPNPRDFEIKFSKKGEMGAGSMPTLGKYFRQLILLNKERSNFRIVSPDELASNRLDAVLDVTSRAYSWPISDQDKKDSHISADGRVMEMLSEHTLQSWLQGYVLTGRHGVFPSYEAFLPIVDSMVSQYLKFIKSSEDYYWRTPVSALNYILSSVCWRQDHNGFSHQNPGFINTLLSKGREEKLVRIYFPADANMLLATMHHALSSTNRVNVIVADKQPSKQWLSYQEAVKQADIGAGIWHFASHDNPDVVLAACGDYQVQEGLAAIQLLRKHIPELKIRFVNISELNVLGSSDVYPNALDEKTFNSLFTPDKEVIFSFHGYAEAVKQLLFDRPNNKRFHIHGYNENGTTTTPFDMLVRNEVSRYHIAMQAMQFAKRINSKVSEKERSLTEKFGKKIKEHRNYIIENGKDPEEINAWIWK